MERDVDREAIERVIVSWVGPWAYETLGLTGLLLAVLLIAPLARLGGTVGRRLWQWHKRARQEPRG